MLVEYQAIKSISPCVFISKYRESCQSLLTKASSIKLRREKKTSAETVSPRLNGFLPRRGLLSRAKKKFFPGFYSSLDD